MGSFVGQVLLVFSLFVAPFGRLGPKSHLAFHISPTLYFLLFSSCENLIALCFAQRVALSSRCWDHLVATCFQFSCFLAPFGRLGPKIRLAFHISPTLYCLLFSSYENLIVLCFAQCVALSSRCWDHSVATCFYFSCFLAPFGRL
jgi:hypothetical protein